MAGFGYIDSPRYNYTFDTVHLTVTRNDNGYFGRRRRRRCSMAMERTGGGRDSRQAAGITSRTTLNVNEREWRCAGIKTIELDTQWDSFLYSLSVSGEAGAVEE